MSSEPPPRVLRRPAPAAVSASFVRQTRPRAILQLLLQRPGQRLIGVAPLGQADLLDVGERGLGDDLVEVLRPRAAEHLASAAARCRSSSPPPFAIVSPISHSSLMCA